MPKWHPIMTYIQPPELVSCHFIFYNFTLERARAFMRFVFTFTVVQFYFYWNKKMILFQWFIYFQLSESSQSYVVNEMSSSNPIFQVGSILDSFTKAFFHRTPKAPLWMAFLFSETVPRHCFPLVLFRFSVSKKWSLRKKNSDK